MVMTTSHAWHSAAGDVATFAPSFARGCVLGALLFHTTTSWPQLMRRCAIAAPILPVPHTPIFMSAPRSSFAVIQLRVSASRHGFILHIRVVQPLGSAQAA